VLEAFHNLEAFVKRTDVAVAQIENEIFVSGAHLQEFTAKYQQTLAEQHNRGDTVDQRMRIYELKEELFDLK
jgi:hypothetical protein